MVIWMRNKKRIFAVITSVILLGGLLCGCGLNKKEVPPENSKQTPDMLYSSQEEKNKSDNNNTDTTVESAKKSSFDDSENKQYYITGTSTSIPLLEDAVYYSEILTYISYGDSVKLIKEDEDTGYSYVYYKDENLYGYIDSNYITEEKSEMCAGETYYIRVNDSIMYNEANESSYPCKTFYEGDEVTVIAKTSGGFWKIKPLYEDLVGWIPVSCLSEATENGDDSILSQGQEYVTDRENQTTYSADLTQDSLNDTASGTNAPSSTSHSTITEELVSNAQAMSGGSWSAYIYVPSTGEIISVNENAQQSASLIKLFIMGAVYENYDELSTANGELDSLLYQMITVSDNSAANTLISLLGGGDSNIGMQVVNNYCSSYGFSSTSMSRLMLQPNTYGDNYTSTGDCGRFLLKVYNGELSHSIEMLNLLKQQTRTSKIPAGVPYGVVTANKTGELDYVQNDVAIVYGDTPYIICVMSENLSSSEAAIQSIVDISSGVYEYIN